VQIKDIQVFFKAILNSYSIVFFSKEKYFALLLLFVSFINIDAGVAGLLALITSLIIGYILGFNKQLLNSGLYSFNALLLGVGLGTFYTPCLLLYGLVICSAFFTLLTSVILNDVLGKRGLPFLTLPYIFTFWLVLLAVRYFPTYLTKSCAPHVLFPNINFSGFPTWIVIYCKSLSTIFFQESVLAGMLMSIGFLIYSRIAFSLTIIGFLCAYAFNNYLAFPITPITYVQLGCNYMMVIFALGCFFLIPSFYSYLLAMLTIPLTALLMMAISKLLLVYQLPLFSVSFSLIVIGILYFLRLRDNAKKLTITSYQLYSPENNLYQFKNSFERLKNAYQFKLYLPFMGEWAVSQGYDGSITHKEEWGNALDFVILDNEMKTYDGAGTVAENFYCYNKPVLAPADGIIQDIKNNIDDNLIGEIDSVNNWGNTIVIYHAIGIYTQLSHLKKNSFQVKIGDYIKKGDILALCGNSGRSPEPHLHFQVQATPHIGSKTLPYPISFYLEKNKLSYKFKSYDTPAEGSFVCNLETNSLLKQAFLFQPGYIANYQSNGVTETWEVYTDAYNLTYIWCKQTNAIAYFVNNGTVFYFTTFTGNKKSLLYLFYLSAYKVVLSFMPNEQVKDILPISLASSQPLKWLQDFIAPFYQFIKPEFTLKYREQDAAYYTNKMLLESQIKYKFGGMISKTITSEILLEDGAINCINIKNNNKQRSIQCVPNY
jgi:murein DD-endopeptidase MepM/ murein hydrolase activator NlpD/urea transporter